MHAYSLIVVCQFQQKQHQHRGGRASEREQEKVYIFASENKKDEKTGNLSSFCSSAFILIWVYVHEREREGSQWCEAQFTITQTHAHSKRSRKERKNTHILHTHILSLIAILLFSLRLHGNFLLGAVLAKAHDPLFSEKHFCTAAVASSCVQK
jgi:hypothetical protein